MSLTSPGLVICQPPSLRCFVWAQRKREVGKIWFIPATCSEPPFDQCSEMKIQVMPMIPKDGPRIARMGHVAESVVKLIQKYCSPKTTHIRIEGYAFAMHDSSSVTKLGELGGITRYLLSQHYTITDDTDLPPTHAKKVFAGTGRATKLDMLEAWKRRGFCDVLALFGLQLSKDKKVPKPVEDIVDALGICYTAFHDCQPKQPPKKKRKRCKSSSQRKNSGTGVEESVLSLEQ